MSKQRILIVEDNRWLGQQYVRILNGEGYKTFMTSDAWGAIQAVDDFKPDAIVLDLLLIGSTGFAFMNELQTYKDTSQIPIILCTNLASELSAKDLEIYGIKRVLDKTAMLPNDLGVAIKSVLV